MYLELRRYLHIYAACFALSLVNLCRIPYESLVMLLNQDHVQTPVHISIIPTLGVNTNNHLVDTKIDLQTQRANQF